MPSGAELTGGYEALVPAALRDVIDEATAREIEARLLVEAADLPSSPEASSRPSS